MGIRGLTSYISQNADRFHQFHQLHDCTVVIDGCSLACQLYIHVSGCNSAFGGDYDKYANTIKSFFLLLAQCNVIPLVIVDGGYETRKLKTVWKRMKTKLHNANACNPVNQFTASVFPLFLMEVFKQVLSNMGVKFAQADFEADFEIAAIARYLNCPVLSYDSDFYVFDVKYIPFSTVSLTPSKVKKNGSVQYYVNCQLYVVEHFISNFGGLDKSLLPLMATLLGNDYVPAYIFSKFFNHVKLPKSKKMSQQQRRIAATFEWLRKETLQSAVNKILNHLRKGDREYVKKQIVQSVASYSHCSSELIPYLGLNSHNEDTSGLLMGQLLIQEHNYETNIDTSEVSESSSEEIDSDTSSEASSECFLEDKSEYHDLNLLCSSRFPPWLRDKFRRGDIPSYLSDIYHLHLYVCQPQVEDFTLNDSHAVSFPILKIIGGLLLGGVQEESDQSAEPLLTCYSRVFGAKPQKLELQSTSCLPCLSPLPSLESIPTLLLPQRKRILYSSFGISSVEDTKILESFGDKWELFALAVVFWARNATTPTVSNCHLHAIIMSMITLGVVDKKLGQIRKKKEILKKKAEKMQNSYEETLDAQTKSQNDNCSQNNCIKTEILLNAPHGPHCSIKYALMEVSETECLNAVESLLQFHQVDSRLYSSPRQFCPSIVHAFAQLQACLLQASSLNAILDHPVPPCIISETYSGTVCYMAFSNFNRRSDVEAYINTLMSDAPSLHAAYKALLAKFGSLLPCISVLYRKGKRKSKRKHHKISVSDAYLEDSADHDESKDTFDVNNKFSILSVL